MSKEFGGGELLRAMLEAEAVDSMPFFYMVPLTGANGQAPQLSFQTATVQTETDTCFLMTSIWGLASGVFVDQFEYVSVFDAAANDVYMSGASSYFTPGAPFTWTLQNSVFVGLLNDSLASCITLPEYILWGPNSLIGVNWLGKNTISFTAYRYLVLGGVKYHLKGT